MSDDNTTKQEIQLVRDDIKKAVDDLTAVIGDAMTNISSTLDRIEQKNEADHNRIESKFGNLPEQVANHEVRITRLEHLPA